VLAVPPLGALTPTVLLAPLAIPVCAALLFFTRWGLGFRDVGESAAAARIAGLNVTALQTSAIVLGLRWYLPSMRPPGLSDSRGQQ